METSPARGRRGNAGFSLVEVAIVVVIGLIITATGLPRFNIVIANMKLRSSITTVSGLLQNCRMLAVQRNRTLRAAIRSQSVPANSMKAVVTEPPDTTNTPIASNAQVEMEAPINSYDAPTGVGAPAAISNSTLGVSVTPVATDPSFNSRGIPCAWNTSTSSCDTNRSFIKYFKDNRVTGGQGWAAISITPAGRIKRWFWNGASWTD
jgi:prepilin-type N-terminal cleavage/methylation domain-containing protein